MRPIAKASIVSTGVDYAHRIRAGHHELVADEPAALGGQGTGPAPFDLYLASLSACTTPTAETVATSSSTISPRTLDGATPTRGDVVACSWHQLSSHHHENFDDDELRRRFR